jgi:tellurite resistance protein
MRARSTAQIIHNQQAGLATGSLPIAPASFFAMTLGLAETGNALRFAHDVWNVPHLFGEILEFLAVLSFLWWGLLYVNKWLNHRSVALHEWREPVQASFIALVPESFILLALAFFPYQTTLAHVLFWVGSTTNLAYAAIRLAGMWTAPRKNEQVTPSLFLTYTASVLVNSLVAGLFGYKEYGWMVFGIGAISWLLLDSVLLQQLITGGLDAKTRNFMGIYMAPAAIVLVAYQVLSGNSSDFMTYALAGYALFLTISLAFSYKWLRQQVFAPGYWAYTFGVATVAQGFLLMVREQHSPVFEVVTGIILLASLLLTLVVVVGTVYLFSNRKYYPQTPAAPVKV